MYRKIIPFILLGILLLSLTGCGSSDQSGEFSVPNPLKVGTEAAYAPFEFVDEKTGEITGFDIEFMKLVASELGVDVEFQNIAWDGLVPSLDSGAVDVVISAMTITPEREENRDFSIPYHTVRGQGMAVKSGSGIEKAEDLDGLTAGVQANTTGDYVAEDLAGTLPKGLKISRFDTTPDALTALVAGSVDAVIADQPVIENYIKNNPNSGIVMKEDPEAFPDENYGIVMKNNSPELKAVIDKAIEKVMDSDAYVELYKKWFDTEPAR